VVEAHQAVVEAHQAVVAVQEAQLMVVVHLEEVLLQHNSQLMTLFLELEACSPKPDVTKVALIPFLQLQRIKLKMWLKSAIALCQSLLISEKIH
jgi:hypothetical protein